MTAKPVALPVSSKQLVLARPHTAQAFLPVPLSYGRDQFAIFIMPRAAPCADGFADPECRGGRFLWLMVERLQALPGADLPRTASTPTDGLPFGPVVLELRPAAPASAGSLGVRPCRGHRTRQLRLTARLRPDRDTGAALRNRTGSCLVPCGETAPGCNQSIAAKAYRSV